MLVCRQGQTRGNLVAAHMRAKRGGIEALIAG